MKNKKLLKFICLVYFNGKKLHSMKAKAKAAFDESSLAYDQLLQKKGHYVIAEALQSQNLARTVRVRAQKTTVVDGPFAKSKKPLGGFILIQAKNMKQAEAIAAGIPLATLGWVEVRPIFDFS